jgi:hypothetical protein
MRVITIALALGLLAPAARQMTRPEGSNLPPPQKWQGSMDDFDPGFWQHGVWRHGLHDHRMGWWYKVRNDWFAFDEPILPYPDLFTPTGYATGWWYWCDAAGDYYPYATLCPARWTQLPRQMIP